jgi:hypothetical protein
MYVQSSIILNENGMSGINSVHENSLWNYNSTYDGSTDVGVSSTSIFLIHAPIEPLHRNPSFKTFNVNAINQLTGIPHAGKIVRA